MIGVTWTGWDGSSWDLASGRVHLGKGGVEGFSMLSGVAFTRDTALSDGQYFNGWRADPRTVLLPVVIGQEASENGWLELERAWWRTMRIDRAGVLAVTAPDGSIRRLNLRFVDDGGMPMDTDPSQRRVTIAALKMVADDPWWAGDPFSQTFDNGGERANFFGGDTNLATPFIISSAARLDSATIMNPGDVPAWPTYIIEGPVTSFRAAIDGKAISWAQPIPEGQSLRIETAPQRQVAFLINAGIETNVTRQLTATAFAPIPDGQSVTLDIQMVGDGSITIYGIPKYYRAW